MNLHAIHLPRGAAHAHPIAHLLGDLGAQVRAVNARIVHRYVLATRRPHPRHAPLPGGQRVEARTVLESRSLAAGGYRPYGIF